MSSDQTNSSKSQISLSPTTQSAVVLAAINVNAKVGIESLADELTVQAQAINNGDLSRVEAMLVAQAHSLDTLFAKLANEALKIGADDALGRMSIALQAQAQCQATLQTLVELKTLSVHPRVK